MNPFTFLSVILVVFLLAGIRVVYEYKRAVKFRFGKYIGLLQPGIRWIIPIVDRIQLVDIRVITINIQKQEVMTQDNVPCHINGVLFLKLKMPQRRS